jgi:hypothetical protein
MAPNTATSGLTAFGYPEGIAEPKIYDISFLNFLHLIRGNHGDEDL